MPVGPTPVLQKQQNKLPTSMRYERVQDILLNDLALKPLLGPKNHPIDSRFGEKIMFSKEAVEVTNAIHAEGKDAHKVSKHEVLKIASRILKVLPTNGDLRTVAQPAAQIVAPAPTAVTPAVEKKSQKPKASPKAKISAEKPGQKIQSDDPPAPNAIKPKKTAAAKPTPKTAPAKTKSKAAEPVRLPKTGKSKKKEAAKPVELPPSERDAVATSNDEADVPESELPPEKQPLHLPAAFDPKKYPHYDVQSSAYSMLLSTLTLVTHYEKYPGFEERQRKLELLLKEYMDTCNQIKIG